MRTENNGLETIMEPSALMRPISFWSWNDKLDEGELRRQIREMADKGWGGYFMHSRVGLVTEYLSDEWMRLINACVDEASKTGTLAWLYDEDKWPSGFAGGEIPAKDEAFRSKALVLVKQGEETSEDTVLASVDHERVAYSICRRVSRLENPWFNGASYVDLMNPVAVCEFLKSTHEKYKKACGEHFGKTIPGIFTDEPCYIFLMEHQVPAVPWSDWMPDFFLETRGYDIREKLPMLFFDIDGYHKARFDFYDTASDLFKLSFTKQYFDWCEGNNLILTGHFMAEDSLSYQTQWSGDVMSHYEFMHWPGVDKLMRTVEPAGESVFAPGTDPLVTIKQLSSAVDQLGKERSLSEVFGCTGQQVSFFHRKWIGDWSAALGISVVNHHLSLYSMRGERKRDFPPNFFYQQPWWDDEKGFADYQGRLCAAVSEGKRLVDILVFQPLTSVWSEYSPLHRSDGGPELAYDLPFSSISRMLSAEKLDYHYGNENLMAKHASVQGDVLRIGDSSYKYVIVPPASNIKSSTLSLFVDHVRQGGRLIFAGEIPSLVDGVPTKIDLPGAVVASSFEEAVRMAAAAFPDRISVTDRLSGHNASAIYLHSRTVGGSTRHFFANIDEKREVHARITIPDSCNKDLAVLDLHNGRLYRIAADDGSFDVILHPAGSLLVIVGEEASTANAEPPAALGCGAAFEDFSKSVPLMLIDEFDCALEEENVLPLNDFALELDGHKVYEGPACGAWHTHFYPSPEGTRFKATYAFYSECDLNGCFASIEAAENLDAITFNGVPVTPLNSRGETGEFDPARSWKDVNFTKLPLPQIRNGKNVLVIEGRKMNNITGPGCHRRVSDWREHRPTESEEIYICGKFSMKQLSDGLWTIAPFRKPLGKNLTKEGFPFYSGRVVLKSHFRVEPASGGRVLLKLNGVAVASACVRVNGVECGTLRWSPFVVDITDAVNSGDNNLELDIATTLVNAFGPNRRAGVKEQLWVGPREFVDMSRFKAGYELFDFGVESVGIYAGRASLPKV